MDKFGEFVSKSETVMFDTQTWEPVFREEEACSDIEFSPDSRILILSYLNLNEKEEIKLFNISEKHGETYSFVAESAFLTKDNNYLIAEKVLDIKNNEIYSLEKWVDDKPNAYDEKNSLLLVASSTHIQLLHFDINSLITSISQDNENLGLYPNPASDFIEISIDGAHLEGGQNMDIEIYDVLGNLVINSSTPSLLSNATPQEGNFKINVSNLPRGVYFVKIGYKVEKFIKK